MSQKQAIIERLFRTHYARMYQRANVLLHDEEESKDAVSDVFARLVQNDQMSEKSITESYLLVAVRNRCMDYIAHRQVRQRVERLIPTDNVVYLSDAVEEKRYEDIRQFVETELTEQDQRIFRMRFDEKMTYKEISDALDVTEKTVYKHLHQAITKLQEHFNGQDNE